MISNDEKARRAYELTQRHWLPSPLTVLPGATMCIQSIWTWWARDIAEQGQSCRTAENIATLVGTTTKTVRKACDLGERYALFQVERIRRARAQPWLYRVLARRPEIVEAAVYSNRAARGEITLLEHMELQQELDEKLRRSASFRTLRNYARAVPKAIPGSSS